MSFWNSVDGMVTVELTGADPGKSLQAINERNIRLQRVVWAGELTVRFRCSGRSSKEVAAICQKRGDTIRFSEYSGLLPLGKNLLRRPILSGGMVLFFALTMLLPTRVLFFRVEGNETVPARQILETAADCGIHFGVSRRAVRSEKMKNALLGAMPQLKWAGINTSGCTAVISVRERSLQDEKAATTGVSSIVAARDGFVTSCTVTRGNGLCVPGQVVKQGQVLISGYTDCGLCIQVTEAEGEIFADTNRTFSAVMPSVFSGRSTKTGEEWRWSLIIGKKRINFWKDSGISPATCGRMYKEYYITLPGGFRLPVCLGVETLTQWEMVPDSILPDAAEALMGTFARETVLSQTVAGQILQEKFVFSQEEERYFLEGRFQCSEMIGRVITEEIGETNGKTD